MSYMQGESEYISCPHYFRVAGLEGCTAKKEFNCRECTHPDRRVEKCVWTSASTENSEP